MKSKIEYAVACYINTLVGAKLGFYITGYRMFNFRFHSLTQVDFTNLINSSSIKTFFFMFVSPEQISARGLKPPCNPVELYNCLSIKVIRATPWNVHSFVWFRFPYFSCECPRGCRGTAQPSPCINILSVVGQPNFDQCAVCVSAHPARKFAAIRWSGALKRRNGMQGLR